MTVTTPDGPPAEIGYATEHALPPTDRPLIGWAAIVYGAVSAVGVVAYAWLAFGPAVAGGVSYRTLGPLYLLLFPVSRMSAAAMAFGGALVLRRSPAGVRFLRAGAAAEVALAAGRVAYAAVTNPMYVGLWSAPATAAVQAQRVVENLSAPVLLAALTWLLPRRPT